MAAMKKIIVTSGQPFTDIDALACAIAYVELLNLEGVNAETVLPGPLNKSVTKKIIKWNLKFQTTPDTKDANYVLVDISESEYFAEFVSENNVIEIFDHRYGYEEYWKKKLGNKAKIEMVGACATLIWEEFEERNKDNAISNTSANLLYTAIASNTLNFQASVTTKRDKNAFKKLKSFINLPKDWIKTYFKDQDKETKDDIKNAIINDTKNLEPYIGQLELWDSKSVIMDRQEEIEDAFKSFRSPYWFLTSPSLSEGINYLFTKNNKIKKILQKAINAKFNGDLGKTDKLWLRKEIFKKLKETN
jgi:inorganic pyrophosphatase/exopolyphosphatase